MASQLNLPILLYADNLGFATLKQSWYNNNQTSHFENHNLQNYENKQKPTTWSQLSENNISNSRTQKTFGPAKSVLQQTISQDYRREIFGKNF